MIFHIYLPDAPDSDTATYYTSIEADTFEQAEEIAAQMMEDKTIPEYYPY